MFSTVVLIVAAVAVAVGLLAVKLRTRSATQIANDDAAFEGPATLTSLTPERVAEIAEFVDRVGLISTGIEEVGGRHTTNRVIENFDVFIIDVAGAIHDVGRVSSAHEAASMAREVARRLDVPLEDPNHILDDL